MKVLLGWPTAGSIGVRSKLSIEMLRYKKRKTTKGLESTLENLNQGHGFIEQIPTNRQTDILVRYGLWYFIGRFCKNFLLSNITGGIWLQNSFSSQSLSFTSLYLSQSLINIYILYLSSTSFWWKISVCYTRIFKDFM